MIDPDEQRRAFRRFVRENHPDRGGDPAVFAEGLRRLREGRPAVGTFTVEVHFSRSPLATLSRSYQRWRRRRRSAPPTGRVR